MDKVLPILTERATTARDQQAVRMREAAGLLQQAGATLDRLQEFRTDCIARSPTARGGSPDGQSMADYQRFLGRLDEAITLQQQECVRRQERSAAVQQALIENQKRLMAFETLARRRGALRLLKDSRVAQRMSDEFAARAASLQAQEKPQ